MKKTVIFANLSVISLNLLGMQHNMLYNGKRNVNTKKHIQISQSHPSIIKQKNGENIEPLKESFQYIYDSTFRWGDDIEDENSEKDTLKEDKTEEKLPENDEEQSFSDSPKKEQTEIINADLIHKLYQDNFVLQQQNKYLLERNALLEWQLWNLVTKPKYEYNQGFYQEDIPLEIDENGFVTYNYETEENFQERIYDNGTAIKPVEETIEQQTPENVLSSGKVEIDYAFLNRYRRNSMPGGLWSLENTENQQATSSRSIEFNPSNLLLSDGIIELPKEDDKEPSNLNQQNSGNKKGATLNDKIEFRRQVSENNVDAVRSMLESYDGLVNCVDNGGWTVLHTIAYKICKGKEENKRNLEIAKLLLENGADVNAKTNDKFESTSLYLAVDSGNIEMVKLFFSKKKDDTYKYNVDINEKNSSGWTTLHIAINRGYFEIAKLLLENGADVNEKTADKFESTPLHLAQTKENKKIAKLIESYLKTDSNKTKEAILSNNYESIEKLLRTNKKLINIPIDEKGNTPLHLAVKNEDYDLIKKLIDRGADKEKKNKDGDTPLLVAIKNKNSLLINMLISSGADINVQDANGDTPLHLAATKRNKEIVELLLKQEGIIINAKDRADRTALQIAEKRYPDVAKLIEGYLEETLDQTEDQDDKKPSKPQHSPSKKSVSWGDPLIIEHKIPTEYDIKSKEKPEKIILLRGQTLEDIKEFLEEAGLAKELVSEKDLEGIKSNQNVENDSIFRWKDVVIEDTEAEKDEKHESTDFEKQQSLTDTIMQSKSSEYDVLHKCVEEAIFPKRNLIGTSASGNEEILEILVSKETKEKEPLVPEQSSENESEDTDEPEDLFEGMDTSLKILEIWPSSTNSDNQLSKDDDDLRTLTEINQDSSDSVETTDSQQIQSRKNTEALSIEWVKQRIDEGLINDVVDESGNTLLHVAVKNNNIEIIKLLLENNANLNIKDEVGHTALHNAVLQETLSIVNLLLENKAKPNLGNNGNTSPLMLAANIGNLKILKTLIKHGSQVNATNDDENNALMIALLSNNCDLSTKYNMAVILLNKDLDIINQVNNNGETAQSIAKSRNFVNINKLIIEARKKLNKINEQKKKKRADDTKKSTIKLTDNHKKIVNQASETNDDTSEISKETIKIKNSSDSTNEISSENVQENKTKTSVGFENFWENLIDNYKKFFNTKGKDDNFPMQREKETEVSKIQATLKEAILSNNGELITELLGGDKELLNTSIDDEGNTPLLQALTKKCQDVVDMIMNYDDNIDFTRQNKDGKTAFIFAAENEDFDTLCAIIEEKRPGVNIADEDGNTPLIIMLKSDDYAIAKITTYKLLVEYRGVDVNHKNKNGETALIVALKQNRLEIAARLLKNPNLRLDVTNEEGNTQLNLAMDVFQKTLESQYLESQDDLVQKTLNVLAELKKGDIEKANQLIIANFKDLKENRESDLEILNSFRNALLAL